MIPTPLTTQNLLLCIIQPLQPPLLLPLHPLPPPPPPPSGSLLFLIKSRRGMDCNCSSCFLFLFLLLLLHPFLLLIQSLSLFFLLLFVVPMSSSSSYPFFFLIFLLLFPHSSPPVAIPVSSKSPPFCPVCVSVYLYICQSVFLFEYISIDRLCSPICFCFSIYSICIISYFILSTYSVHPNVCFQAAPLICITTLPHITSPTTAIMYFNTTTPHSKHNTSLPIQQEVTPPHTTSPSLL